MRDKVVKFSRNKSLVGILSEPAAGASRGEVGVILLNSGILHRVGACRLHVNLARQLAAQGFTTLRFDFSGIGDSESRKDDLSFEQAAIVEIRDAMDYLGAAKGIRRFILAGLCSGADMAHQTACADERVVGMALLDAWCYRTPQYYLHHYGKRIGRPEVWKNFFAIRLRRLLKGSASSVPAQTDSSEPVFELPRYVREYPPQEKVEADLKGFMGRAMNLFFIFSGGQEDLYNYRGQYEDSFRGVDFEDRLRVEYLADADHIFTGLDHQQYVIREVVGWLGALIPATQSIPVPTAQAVRAFGSVSGGSVVAAS